MAMSGRVTRRSTPTASQRFHGAPRSRPVLLLIGGIGACFAIVIAFVLLGGTPDDGLHERINQLESKAAKLASEEKREEAIKVYEELIGIAVGERYKVKILEWRAVIKELKAEILLFREASAKLGAWAKAAEASTPDQARPLYEEGCRLRDAMPRLWKHDALLAKLLALIPTGPPGWQEKNRRINDEHKTDKRGGHWSRALRDWKDYLALKLPPADREGAGNCVSTLEQKARDEVRALVNRAATPEDREGLKLHRLRFEGTAAAAELEKAIAGR
jgi:hypothetical protein